VNGTCFSESRFAVVEDSLNRRPDVPSSHQAVDLDAIRHGNRDELVSQQDGDRKGPRRRVRDSVCSVDDSFRRLPFAVGQWQLKLDAVFVRQLPSPFRGHFEFHLHRVHHLQRHDRLAALNSSAGNHMHLRNLTSEWSLQHAVVAIAFRILEGRSSLFNLSFQGGDFGRLSLLRRVELHDRCLCRFQIRIELVELRFGDRFLIKQILRSVVVFLSQ